MVGVLYLAPKIMENRKPFALKWPMFVWNFFLFLFSLYCLVGFTWRLFVQSRNHGLEVLICDKNGRLWEGIDLFYVWMFLISKFVELGDTVFLVLRKSKVIFLHWSSFPFSSLPHRYL
jgi:elongation of very long chain fatty acids protein 6